MRVGCFFLQKDEVYLNLVLEYIPETVYKVARHYSKSRQTIPISFIKVPDLVPYPVSVLIFLFVLDSCTCTSCSDRWRTSTHWASVTGTSSRRTCCLTPTLASSNCATLVVPSTWSVGNRTSPIFVVVITGKNACF